MEYGSASGGTSDTDGTDASAALSTGDMMNSKIGIDFFNFTKDHINTILKKEVEKDWWDQLPFEVQDSIIEGIHNIEDGKVFTHGQVIQEVKEKYGF